MQLQAHSTTFPIILRSIAYFLSCHWLQLRAVRSQFGTVGPKTLLWEGLPAHHQLPGVFLHPVSTPYILIALSKIVSNDGGHRPPTMLPDDASEETLGDDPTIPTG